MLDFIFNAIIWVLALYGLIEVIKTIIYTYTYTNLNPNGIYVIIAVKNQADKIEGFLRALLFRVIYGKEENIKNVIAVDLNSKDETKKIITFTTSELKTLNQTSVLTYEVTNNSSNYDANVTVTCVPKTGTTAKYTSIKNKLDNDATKVSAKSSVNGTLTVTLDKVATESVTEEYTCKLEFNAVERDTLGENIPDPVSFTSDSWKTIQKAVQTGNTSKYNVGDTKEVDLGSLGTHTVRIANKSACTTETSETACGFVVEFADIITNQKFNSTKTNVGGWRDSELRTYVNGTIYDSLPSDLQNVIASTKVISGHGNKDSTNFETQDKLYLLNAQEVWNGNSYDASVGTSKQLDYYKNKGVTTIVEKERNRLLD